MSINQISFSQQCMETSFDPSCHFVRVTQSVCVNNQGRTQEEGDETPLPSKRPQKCIKP